MNKKLRTAQNEIILKLFISPVQNGKYCVINCLYTIIKNFKLVPFGAKKLIQFGML